MFTEDPIKKNNVHISGNLNAQHTLVFGHGFGTDQSTWSQIIPAFEADYRIVA